MSNNIGIYIHVPFCQSFCPYCDFYKTKIDKNLGNEYVNAVKRELEKRKASLASKVIDTIYFGGGTPSVLSCDSFTEIFNSIYDNYTVLTDAEITVECNPSSKLEGLIPNLVKLGVNRISMGMQTANDNERRALGRLSNTERIENCIALIRENCIENITLDLMIGIPNQTISTLDESLEFIQKSKVPHVSAYMLKIEEGTNFFKRRNELNIPTEDETAYMYIRMCEYFENIGLSQYEISNFAVPSFESKHNLKYWKDCEYLGIGPSAHSYLFGQRFYMKNDLNAFIDGCEPIQDGLGGSYEERLMLALRLSEGYTGQLSEHTKKNAFKPEMTPFLTIKPVDIGRSTNEECYNISLTRNGFLVSNTIISSLI